MNGALSAGNLFNIYPLLTLISYCVYTLHKRLPRLRLCIRIFAHSRDVMFFLCARQDPLLYNFAAFDNIKFIPSYKRPGRYIEAMGEKDTFSSSPRSRRLA